MSTADELGEAAIIEAMEATADADLEPDADAAPPEPAAAGGKEPPKRRRKTKTPTDEPEGEQQQQQIGALASSYVEAVRELLGDDFDNLIVSPLDWIPGFLWRPDLVPLEEDVKTQVWALLQMEPPIVYPPAPDARGCEACSTTGMQRTGSSAAGHELKTCLVCGGVGWVANVTVPAVQGAAGGLAAATPTHLPPPPGTGLPDAWDRPAGHPHWGIRPSELGA